MSPLLVLSKFLCIVYSTQFHTVRQATPEKSEKLTYTEAEDHSSRGITIKGMRIAPKRPIPEHSPKPLVLIIVSKDYVVRGYKIENTSFMKNLAIDPIEVKAVKAKKRWKIAAPAKNIKREFFLPYLGWSIMKRVRNKLGNSPNTVKKYLYSPSRRLTCSPEI